MTNPPEGKDELSRGLRDLRGAAGLGTRDVAAQAGFSQAKVSRLERGINVPTEDDVTRLLDVYQAAAATRRHLLGLARDIRAEHRPVVMARSTGRPGAFQARLARIEAASAHVRAFAPTAVPGLLQTETYMRHLIAPRQLPQARVEEFVTNRRKRQEALGQAGRRFTIVTTVAGLGWRLGTREDMALQAAHIANLVSLSGVRIGVIPWGQQASRVVLHGWDIYDERAVSYGTTEATAVLTTPRDVRRYSEMFDLVEGMASWGDGARREMAEVARRYREGAW